MSYNSAQRKYDVFVSFKGEICRKFLSHLVDAFRIENINVFIVDKLERRDKLWIETIEASAISLIIFSPNYASSRWCLEELVTILDFKEKHGKIVIPVFYSVEPTHVRHQSSHKYKSAFVKHERKHNSKVQIWRDALKKSADLSGIESSKFQNDAELLKEIVNLVQVVLMRFDKPQGGNFKGFVDSNSKGLVGIDERIAHVESLIRKRPRRTRVIGIWGVGGIGKTTLVGEVFNKLKFEYEGSYFLADERVQSSKHGIVSLEKEIFSKLLGYDVQNHSPNFFTMDDHARRHRRMKVLLVLENVYDSEHLEQLLRTRYNFGSGSTIIITTRDEQVLKGIVDDTYHLKELSSDESLNIFNSIVFNRRDNEREYSELSKRAVDYAKGIPLVVKVLAHHLCGKKKEVWESVLDKLEEGPKNEVYDILKWSYDDLDSKQQQIFLDLAGFFLRWHQEINMGHLESLMKHSENDNSVVAHLERLKNKGLITFSKDNFVSVHDILQKMAWEIVHRESSELGNRSRLWDPADVYEVLRTGKVTEAIRSIHIHLPTIKKLKLVPHIFAKMSGLQFLTISGECNDDLLDQHCILAEELQFLESELRLLYWVGCPLKFLPQNFSAERLAILSLQHGNMEKLWHGVKNLVNLKEVDLSWSKMLKELPDLSNATNLEAVILMGCSKLISVHPSIFSLPKLEKLDLQSCISLTKLASDSHLCKLSYLNLASCENLTEFSVISENMKELRLDWTKIKSLPLSFELQLKLQLLNLQGSDIEKLPPSISSLPKLLHVDVRYCMKLKTIPKLPPFLKTLNVSGCESLQYLPELPLSLKTLDVSSCSALLTLPELPSSLKTLYALNCKSLQCLPELPPSLETLGVNSCSALLTLPELPSSLKTIRAGDCKSLQCLPELPPSLETLAVSSCSALLTLPELPSSLKTLYALNCKSLQCLPELPPSLETLCVNSCSALLTLPELPSSLKTLYALGCKSLQCLPELPPSLETLDVSRCSAFLTLPELPSSLKTLRAGNCKSLQCLPELPPSLETLDVSRCSALLTLPELPSSLKTLYTLNCKSLQCLPELPPSLETLDVRSCSALLTLPELPSSLKTLYARDCKSLQCLPDFPLPLKL